jgi:chitin biosynthesis protein CHS5
VSESKAQNAFLQLQDDIFHSFGEFEPAAPVLRCRNATQTSVVLEWDPIEVATADVISLSLFRNGQKAGNIPRPTVMQSTKISGLAVDTEYTFHLVLRTSAGTFSSEKVAVKTHKMTDLSGITVTPGILPAQLRDSLAKAVERIGAKMADTVRIDTTHFVTTEGRGMAWEKAVEMNIPVVRPEWVEGCERGGRIVGVRQYYLDADPRQRNIGQSVAAQPSPVEARKDAPLPKLPAEEQRTNGANDNGALSRTVPVHSESKKEEDDGDDDSDDHVEPEAEQKVRVEDMERHKVMVSPTRAESEPESSRHSEKDEEAEETEADDGQKTPGGASFQDVAL